MRFSLAAELFCFAHVEITQSVERFVDILGHSGQESVDWSVICCICSCNRLAGLWLVDETRSTSVAEEERTSQSPTAAAEGQEARLYLACAVFRGSVEATAILAFAAKPS